MFCFSRFQRGIGGSLNYAQVWKIAFRISVRSACWKQQYRAIPRQKICNVQSSVGEGVTVVPSENICSCLHSSFVSEENRYISYSSYTLKIATEDLMTGNLLSTAEIEPGSNNISHNEKKGKVSLWNFTSFSVVFNLQSNIFWTRSISRTTSLIISERFLLQVTSHRSLFNCYSNQLN